jgi:BirA family biotin operon repressor/biotin-[acetyl-CoA-carboxylase] ligase
LAIGHWRPAIGHSIAVDLRLVSAFPPTSAAELTILRQLLDKEPGYVSGAALARKLGISRVAVWQHMEKLRAQGFRFEAARSRGYRLVGRPDALSRPLVDAHLARRTRARLVWLDEIDSTNDEAARLLATGESAPFVVIARSQTRGRGRLGRSWHSAANGNLYISFAFRPSLEPGRMQTFTLWMGVNLCDLVERFCNGLSVRPGVKWPNDLVFDGRKAGGMLTEARMDADRIRDLVFGLGLNIGSTAESWPAPLARQAVSLSQVAGERIDASRLTAALIGRILLAYEQFIDGSYRRTFADLWNRFDALRGSRVTLTEGNRQHAGTALGIDEEGSLLLREERGAVHRYRAGDATFSRPAD